MVMVLEEDNVKNDNRAQVLTNERTTENDYCQMVSPSVQMDDVFILCFSHSSTISIKNVSVYKI